MGEMNASVLQRVAFSLLPTFLIIGTDWKLLNLPRLIPNRMYHFDGERVFQWFTMILKFEEKE